MPTPGPSPDAGGPPEAYLKQVKEALEHLYDYPYLQRHPLARAAGEPDGQRLRRELLAVIETLSPGAATPFRAPHARLYNLLHLRYVEGLTVQEAAHELGISLRQAYRDLRHGEESVAALLWARRPVSPAEPAPLQSEITRLDTRLRPTEAGALIRHALRAVEALAAQRAVAVEARLPEGPVFVLADPMVAQQVFVGLLSQAVRQAQAGPLTVALARSEPDVTLTAGFAPEPASADPDKPPAAEAVVQQLAGHLGWTLAQADAAGAGRRLTLTMRAHGPTVLIIDDNAGLVDLLARYLTDQACRVITATDGREGLQLAREAGPQAIVVDVMMPGMDGWELLQRLRTHPETAAVPVILCSVINDPELALSLGASLCLSKPVSRETFLAALRQLQVL